MLVVCCIVITLTSRPKLFEVYSRHEFTSRSINYSFPQNSMRPCIGGLVRRIPFDMYCIYQVDLSFSFPIMLFPKLIRTQHLVLATFYNMFQVDENALLTQWTSNVCESEFVYSHQADAKMIWTIRSVIYKNFVLFTLLRISEPSIFSDINKLPFLSYFWYTNSGFVYLYGWEN